MPMAAYAAETASSVAPNAKRAAMMPSHAEASESSSPKELASSAAPCAASRASDLSPIMSFPLLTAREASTEPFLSPAASNAALASSAAFNASLSFACARSTSARESLAGPVLEDLTRSVAIFDASERSPTSTEALMHTPVASAIPSLSFTSLKACRAFLAAVTASSLPCFNSVLATDNKTAASPADAGIDRWGCKSSTQGN
mmetsp:Transcript_71052/g.123229  ORF Transcript_71052/g.123229 Transcript_71052/m.123229 type:complete len:202 (+) Transcript_71052:1175-1780(+)